MSLDYKSNPETDKENGEVILIQRKQSHTQIKPLAWDELRVPNSFHIFLSFKQDYIIISTTSEWQRCDAFQP